jgi:hypothetical protein
MVMSGSRVSPQISLTSGLSVALVGRKQYCRPIGGAVWQTALNTRATSALDSPLSTAAGFNLPALVDRAIFGALKG